MTFSKRICVVIPFYQREVGLLRRAVHSIYDQRLDPDVHVRIIVVDDGSPVHAENDLDGAAPLSPAVELVSIRQANGGCAVARNTALSHVTPDTNYIAFLDSDDVWPPDHLATAVAALSNGIDFYFSDHSRDEFYPSYFEQIGFPGLTPTTRVSLSGHDICEVSQRDFFDFFLRRYVPQISTVVYRRSIDPGAAFSSQLRFASEDYLFLLSLVQAAGRVGYGPSDAARCGSGVNVYYSTFSWADEGHIRRNMGDLLGAYAIRSGVKLNDAQQAALDKSVDDLRLINAFFLLRWILKGRFRFSEDLRQLIRADPNFWAWFPAAIPRVIRQHILKQGSWSTAKKTP